MPSTLEGFFERLWEAYTSITPQANVVRELLEARGERFVNDHVAFRTYDHSPINLEILSSVFHEWGFTQTGAYNFEEKCLNAVSFSHPGGIYPRVFLSELRTGTLSQECRILVEKLVQDLKPSVGIADRLLGNGGWRTPSFEVYARLAQESEYAAWVSAFGIRANHFTVSVNALETFGELEALNEFLEDRTLILNSSGGKVKGGPEVLLAQSSTMADRIPWTFAGGRTETIPSCYVEFAFRYPDRGGALYEGFVAQSADRIFESTDS